MQINNNQNLGQSTSFGAFKFDNKATKLIFSRINNPKTHIDYKNITEMEDQFNSRDILVFTTNNGKRLAAELESGKTIKENIFSAIFKQAPASFLEKIHILANKNN